MTKHECAVVMAYTGTVMLTGEDLDIFYKYIAEKMGRPVFSHEIPTLSAEIKIMAVNDFLELCRTASD